MIRESLLRRDSRYTRTVMSQLRKKNKKNLRIRELLHITLGYIVVFAGIQVL
jgi:hypothetical protein